MRGCLAPQTGRPSHLPPHSSSDTTLLHSTPAHPVYLTLGLGFFSSTLAFLGSLATLPGATDRQCVAHVRVVFAPITQRTNSNQPCICLLVCGRPRLWQRIVSLSLICVSCVARVLRVCCSCAGDLGCSYVSHHSDLKITEDNAARPGNPYTPEPRRVTDALDPNRHGQGHQREQQHTYTFITHIHAYNTHTQQKAMARLQGKPASFSVFSFLAFAGGSGAAGFVACRRTRIRGGEVRRNMEGGGEGRSTGKLYSSCQWLCVCVCVCVCVCARARARVSKRSTVELYSSCQWCALYLCPPSNTPHTSFSTLVCTLPSAQPRALHPQRSIHAHTSVKYVHTYEHTQLHQGRQMCVCVCVRVCV